MRNIIFESIHVHSEMLNICFSFIKYGYVCTFKSFKFKSNGIALIFNKLCYFKKNVYAIFGVSQNIHTDRKYRKLVGKRT